MSNLRLQIENCCRYSSRVDLAIAIIVLAVLTPSIRQLPSTVSALRGLTQTDDVSQYERRFTEVKQFLPADQAVAYRDDFDKLSEQCKAFYLAQYSLAPALLVALDSKCDSSVEASGLNSRFVLDNFHDSRDEPYLLHLFSDTGVPSENHPVDVARGQLSDSDHLVLIKDFGHGVKLYSREGK